MMALNAIRMPTRLAVRTMSAQAFLPEFPGLTVPSGGGAPAFSNVESTTLSNGVVVTSQDTGAVASSVSVVVGAGSANETMATAGMAATLEQTAFCSTENQTAFKILRDAEAASVTLSAKAGRKSVSYNATFPRGDVEAVATLAECVTSPALHSWEVSRYGAMAGRVAPSAAEAAVADLYSAAFHNTAGRAPTVPAARVGKVSSDDVASYRAQHFAGANTVVVGVDIPHEELVAAVSGLANLPASSEGTSASPVYYGGESRTSLYAKDTTVAYAVGSSAALPALPAMILRNIIGGNGTALSWSTDASASRVGAAVGKATQEPFTVRGIADDNLVGFYATVAGAESGDATKAAVAAAKEVLAGNFSDEEVSRAKNQLRSEILGAGREGRISALTSAGTTPEALAASVQSVSIGDIKALAATLAKAAPTYAVRGDTDAAPFLSDL